jgi:tyrosine-protein kinase Etk/Wzc
MSEHNMSMPADGAGDDRIHLLDAVITVARSRTLIAATTVAGGLVALVWSLVQTPVFTSTAMILPPQQPQSSGVAAMLGQLGNIAGAAGGGLAAMKNPNDLYVGLLQSRTISDQLIARYKLKERYGATTMDGTRRFLSVNSDIVNSKKDGLIAISVRDKDANFAAELANAYVDELGKLTQTMALTESSQRRLFFEKQLLAARDQLAVADLGLRKTQERTGMIQPEGQLQAIIATVAQLKASIAAKEVQLNAMRTFAASDNPERRRAEGELGGMRAQLAKLERSAVSSGGDFLVPTSKIPQVGAEYISSVRHVKYSETMYEIIAKQFELAKIDEAKESTLVQVLDKAVPAELRTKPRRTMMTLLGLAAGLGCGLVLAFLAEAYRRSRHSADGRQRWLMLDAIMKRKGSR